MTRCTCYDVLIVKDLNRWFKEKWVDVSRKDKDGKHPPCGRSKASKSSKGYPKCRPSVKVSGKTPKTSGSMSEGQKRAATKRKRSKKQGVGGKPTIVKATYQSNLGEHHEDFPSPMDMAWRLLKMPLDWDSFDDEEKKINWIDPSDGRVIQLDGEVSRQYFNGEPQEELDVSISNDKGETIGHAGVTPYHESEEDWQYNPHQKHTVFPSLDKDFQGRGLGADLYHFITALGYPIIADHNNQSPQAQRMWMRNQGASEWGTKDAKGAEWKLKRDDL